MRIAAVGLLAAVLTLAACSSDPASAPTTPTPTSSPSTGSSSTSGTGLPGTSPAGTAAPSTTAATDGSSAPARAVPSAPVRTVDVRGKSGTFHLQIWAEVTNSTCDDHAYGQPVITYLTTHPCRGMQRLLATTEVKGRPVGLARTTVGFSGATPVVYTTAGDFKALITRNGTGNVDDLFRDGYRLPSGPTQVPSPDAFAAFNQDGAVSVLDAWYLQGSTPANAKELLQLAQDLFLQV